MGEIYEIAPYSDCQPDVDSFQLDYPWFPLNNCPQPQKHGILLNTSGCFAAKMYTARTISIGRAAMNGVTGSGEFRVGAARP